MATVPLFKNRKGNVSVCGNKGTYAFANGRFWTVQEDQIEELVHLAKTRQGHIFIDPNEPDIDTEATSPMQVLEKKIISKFLASQASVGVGTTANVASELAAQAIMSKIEDAQSEPPVPSSIKPTSPALSKLNSMMQDKK